MAITKDLIVLGSTRLIGPAYVGYVYGGYMFGNISGNAATADKWKTSRSFTIGNSTQSVDGSGNVSWPLGEISPNLIGAYLPLSGGTMTGDIIFTTSSSALSGTGLTFKHSSTTDAHISSDNNGALGLYGASKIVIRPSVSSSTLGLEITSSTLKYNTNEVWDDDNINYRQALNTSYGVIKSWATPTQTSSQLSLQKTNTSGKYYGVVATKDGFTYVNVPWTDTCLWETGNGLYSLVPKNHDASSLGNYSISEGERTTAAGEASHAEGINSANKPIQIERVTGSGTIYIVPDLGRIDIYVGSILSNGDPRNPIYSMVTAIEPRDNSITVSKTFGHMSNPTTLYLVKQIAVGIASHTEGGNTGALGEYSHAEGYGNVALGDYSHAEGMYDDDEGRGNIAEGNGSHAEGRVTWAAGRASHAEGFYTTASGIYSHAEGVSTEASGVCSHAEGDTTLAFGQESHAEGGGTTASGDYSHAEGELSYSNGMGSHAEGSMSISNGDYSHAENSSIALGKYSHSEGRSTTGGGFASHAEGSHSYARGAYSHAEGQRSAAYGYISHAGGFNTLAYGDFSITFGSNTLAYDFALAIGKQTLAYRYAIASGFQTTAYDYSIAEGYQSMAFSYFSHAEGAQTFALGSYSHAEGNNTRASGNYSHAEGKGAIASGDISHAEGGGIASGSRAHAEGSVTTASGFASHAEGGGTVASGEGAHAEGNSTVAESSFSHAEGSTTIASGNYSHVEGVYMLAYGRGSHAEGAGMITAPPVVAMSGSSLEYTVSAANAAKLRIGYFLNYGISYARVTGISGTTVSLDSTLGTLSSASVKVLHGTSVGQYSHAEGLYATASGNYSHAEGSRTTTYGNASHAEGYNSYTVGAVSHAEGEFTQTTNRAEHAEGRYNKSNTSSPTFGDAGNTIHSVGIGNGTNDRKNAIEVMQNGDVYVKGVGNYDGTSIENVNTLQAVVNASGGGGGGNAGNSKVFYGTCDTAAATVAKVVDCDDFTSADLVEGVMVIVKFSATNSGAVANLKLNVNGTGEKNIKEVYNGAISNLTAAADLYAGSVIPFIYSGTYWIVAGIDYSTANTIGYNLRTNSSTLPMKNYTGRYRLLFTSADGKNWVASTTSTSTNASAARTPTTEKIDPFGEIVYYGSTTTVSAGNNPEATVLWQQYVLSLGYSFTASTLSYPKPVYIKCTPQSDGSAIIDATHPYVQDLPTTEDGYIYIFLGIAYSASAVELKMNHPVYYYSNGKIRIWTGVDTIESIPSSGYGQVKSIEVCQTPGDNPNTLYIVL